MSTSLRNDEIKTSLVSYLKANATIVAELVAGGTGAYEIRESQWQGTELDYPAVRVRLISNRPQNPTPNCKKSNINVSIMVFSQNQSSLEADRIAGIISSVIHSKSFSSVGIQFSLVTTNLVPALRVSERLWRAEVLLIGLASG